MKDDVLSLLDVDLRLENTSLILESLKFLKGLLVQHIFSPDVLKLIDLLLVKVDLLLVDLLRLIEFVSKLPFDLQQLIVP